MVSGGVVREVEAPKSVDRYAEAKLRIVRKATTEIANFIAYLGIVIFGRFELSSVDEESKDRPRNT